MFLTYDELLRPSFVPVLMKHIYIVLIVQALLSGIGAGALHASWSSSRVNGKLYLTSSFTSKMLDAMVSKIWDANTGDCTNQIEKINRDGPCQKL